MNIIEWLKQIFSNKERSILTCRDLTKTKGEDNPLEFILTDKQDNPISNAEVQLTINGKGYTRTTNEQGIGSIKINLNPGEYKALLRFNGDGTYNGSTAYAEIIVNPVLTADDLSMIEGDGSQFIATTKDANGEILTNVPITFTINTKNYEKTTNENGQASLNINLTHGDYQIISTSIMKSITNNIHIDEKQPEPEPEPEPSCSSPYTQRNIHTNQGAGYLGQKTGYYCGPHSVMQCIYDLTGIDLDESTLASVGGTTSSGTGHDGINTMIAWFNRNHDPTLSIEWHNFSDLGWRKIDCLMDREDTALFFHLLYRNQWGHYELPYQDTDGKNILTIANSLGNRSGNGYYGYMESRNISTQEDYISGISQKSVCVIKRVD